MPIQCGLPVEILLASQEGICCMELVSCRQIIHAFVIMTLIQMPLCEIFAMFIPVQTSHKCALQIRNLKEDLRSSSDWNENIVVKPLRGTSRLNPVELPPPRNLKIPGFLRFIISLQSLPCYLTVTIWFSVRNTRSGKQWAHFCAWSVIVSSFNVFFAYLCVSHHSLQYIIGYIEWQIKNEDNLL